ncbi:hypothetical protein ECTW14313_3662, partial [Escherichia coli O157:H7 str. TW14313]
MPLYFQTPVIKYSFQTQGVITNIHR